MDISANFENKEVFYDSPHVATFRKVSLNQFVCDVSYNHDVEKLMLACGYEKDEDDLTYKMFFNDVYDAIELPVRSTKSSAGFDFRAPFAFDLAPGKTIIIPTGIRAMIQNDYVLMLYPRSSIGIKHGISFANTTPIIDADYYGAENEGHIMLAFKNTMPKGKKNIWHVKAGDKICQGIFLQYGITHDDAVNTVRTGGIGSTGK